jgi:hypothetical protein
VEFVYTPPWRTQADIQYTNVSIPADSRFSDLSGTGTDPISPSDAAHKNGQPWLMFYRKDLFSAAGIPKPETTEELLAAARKLNGSDFDGDGSPDYSVCFSRVTGCINGMYTFLSVLAPLLQTTPTSGVFLDPLSMKPLVQNAAMDEALKIFANLSSYNWPSNNAPCKLYSTRFSKSMPLPLLADCNSGTGCFVCVGGVSIAPPRPALPNFCLLQHIACYGYQAIFAYGRCIGCISVACQCRVCAVFVMLKHPRQQYLRLHLYYSKQDIHQDFTSGCVS